MWINKYFKRVFTFCLFFGLIAGMVWSFTVHAQEKDKKVVRVGWYESTYCYRDQYGERRGIAYEYQRKIAEHTGWTYEYVEDSWPNLLQMLMDGDIDLLSDVSYTDERASVMFFSTLPMGSESYYLYIDADNTEITNDDLQCMNGKRVGVNKGSFQEELLQSWMDKNNVSIEIVELTIDEAASMNMLEQGDIDAYVSMDGFGSREKVIPLYKIGSSDYYFSVNKNRPDLLKELNNAMMAIQDEDPYYNQHLFDEYLQLTNTNTFLMPELERWIEEHGTIRIGYLDGMLPFCAADKKTGELTGALKDYLEYSFSILKNANVHFEAEPYPSMEAVLDAMKRGDIDCTFPINISTYKAETLGIIKVNPIMNTDVSILTRAEEQSEIMQGNNLTVAIDEGNISFETLIKDSFPNWTIKKCPSVEECFIAVSSKEADAVLASNYRMSEYESLRTKYKLIDLPTGETMGLSFAVNVDNPELYSILNKIANLSPKENMEYALVSYMYMNQKVSFMDFLEDNWVTVIVSISAVFFIIIVLLMQKLKVERKANEQQRLLEEAAEIAELKQTITSLLDNMPGMNSTKDAETGVYLACNQTFAAYANKRSPDYVVGLTDKELFDAGTAERIAADDRIALSMDEPYIFFEDAVDDEGNRRQIKTTKLKYTDAVGRLCVLGISLDVTTDTVHIHRDKVTTTEDYKKARNTGIIFAHIAQALAQGYSDLYYINLDTEEFIEYRTDDDSGSLTEVRRGWHFFEQCQEEAEQIVYSEDRESVIRALDRKTLVDTLVRNDNFIMTYRLIGEKEPTYVSMKVTRMKDDERYIIMGIMDVDEREKQRKLASHLEEEQIASSRLRALAGDYLCIYIVDPDNNQYREFSSTGNYENYAIPKEGMDFFEDSRKQCRTAVYADDHDLFLTIFTRENVLVDIERYGIFSMNYRLNMDGAPRYVQLKAVLVEEKEGARLIIGVNDIDKQVRHEEEYVVKLAQARIEASIDALTGVKNRYAYLILEEQINSQIAKEQADEFAIVVLDVNDLKKVNDTEGHEAGDQFLRDACKIICDIFKHSPVFRVGGDEFVVVVQGEAYSCVDELTEQVATQNREAKHNGGIVIACGMAKYDNDVNVASVFERADQEMYVNKKSLKEAKH